MLPLYTAISGSSHFPFAGPGVSCNTGSAVLHSPFPPGLVQRTVTSTPLHAPCSLFRKVRGGVASCEIDARRPSCELEPLL